MKMRLPIKTFLKTPPFCTDRLKLITQEWTEWNRTYKVSRKSNQLTDIESKQSFYRGSNEYDKKGVETEIQLNMVNSMLSFLKKSTNEDLLPTNIISGDVSAAE
jgi:hypothetical protein